MKWTLIAASVVILAAIGLFLYAAHWMAGWSRFEFEVGQVALGKISTAGVPVPEGAAEPMYWYECGIDHTAYMSYVLPKEDVPANVRQVMGAWGAAGTPRQGMRSEFYWINTGPKRKPAGWQTRYWDLASVHDGIMYEERYRFVCGDLGTGRVYVSTWSE